MMNSKVTKTVFNGAFFRVLHSGEEVVRVAIEVACGAETLPTNVVIACRVDEQDDALGLVACVGCGFGEENGVLGKGFESRAERLAVACLATVETVSQERLPGNVWHGLNMALWRSAAHAFSRGRAFSFALPFSFSFALAFGLAFKLAFPIAPAFALAFVFALFALFTFACPMVGIVGGAR